MERVALLMLSGGQCNSIKDKRSHRATRDKLCLVTNVTIRGILMLTLSRLPLYNGSFSTFLSPLIAVLYLQLSKINPGKGISEL